MTEKQNYPWHKTLLAHVRQQLSDDRMPHAVLYRCRPHFFDERLGDAVAQLLLCDKHNGCGQCRHCHLMAESTHPNVLSLNAYEHKVGIDDIRQLEQQMWQTSVFDKAKIAIIHGVDLLSIAAQNALLKTLEEPPKSAFFILSVDNLSGVLATIMSRVQRLRHVPQKATQQQQIIHWLQQQLGEQSPTEAEITRVAKLAQFAPQATLSLLREPEQVTALNKEKSDFAQFVSGKSSAMQLVNLMNQEQLGEQLVRFGRYTETLIHGLFNKVAEQGNRRAVDASYSPKWHGVSMQGLYRLRDCLATLQQLQRSNVNMTMQLQTHLTDWQNDRER